MDHRCKVFSRRATPCSISQRKAVNTTLRHFISNCGSQHCIWGRVKHQSSSHNSFYLCWKVTKQSCCSPRDLLPKGSQAGGRRGRELRIYHSPRGGTLSRSGEVLLCGEAPAPNSWHQRLKEGLISLQPWRNPETALKPNCSVHTVRWTPPLVSRAP